MTRSGDYAQLLKALCIKVTRRDQVKVTHPITTAVYTQLLMTLCIVSFDHPINFLQVTQNTLDSIDLQGVRSVT